MKSRWQAACLVVPPAQDISSFVHPTRLVSLFLWIGLN